MITEDIRQTILTLSRKGQKIREICRVLNLSRNTVRLALRGKEPPAPREDPNPDILPLIRELHGRCRGNLVRVHEQLQDRGVVIGYSTLTRWAREHAISQSPLERVGSYDFAPGLEMQFDTSPHRVTLGERTGVCHCAALILAYSRRLHLRYFLTFGRFEAKAFLAEALSFMDGVCRRCVVDNSSVLVARGSGDDAEMAPDVEALARHYGFTFKAHKVRHPERKARIERPFGYIERNFLAGRTFSDLNDLNGQAMRWAREVANRKTKRRLGMSPDEAYILEKPHLLPLPAYIPPVYESLSRIVDTEGFICLETNRYSVPDRLIGKTVEIQKHLALVKVHHKQELVAVHERIIGKRNTHVTAPGHHAVLRRAKRPDPCPEEARLRGESELLDRFVAILKQRSPGRGIQRMRRLLEIKRTYPAESFNAAVTRALHFGMCDLARLEAMIIKHVAGDYFNLDTEDD